MKKIVSKKYILIVLVLAIVTSCDRGFEDLNKNPIAYTRADINALFSLTQVYMNGQDSDNHRANLIYAGAMVQHLASFSYAGDKYIYNADWSGALFASAYLMGIKEVTQLLTIIPDTPENANKRSAARIVRAYLFHRLTDIYGDVPYFEAAKGYTNFIFKPKYDPQEVIYKDLLIELEQSAQAFNPVQPFFDDADLFYQGDLVKWKKFSYSLMLRLAMRLSKVDPAQAQEWAMKAIAGGVFQSNQDHLILQHATGPEGINRNPTTTPFLREDLQGGRGNTKLSERFINELKNSGDPRLRIYARLENSGDNLPENQKGLPNGYNAGTILDHPSWTVEGLTAYSDPNTLTVLRQDAPDIIMSYAEIQLLQAEAAVRGWISGSATDYYNTGVEAAMTMLSIYGTEVAPITHTEISDYLTTNPFNSSGSVSDQYNQIHTQKWILLLFNGIEAYADLRRSGYPIITPVNYPGNITGGTLPRRLIYNEKERINNSENYQEAVARQGPDDFLTRVWWDRP